MSSLNQSTARAMVIFMENLLSVGNNTGDVTYVLAISQFLEKWKRPKKMCLESWKLESYCSTEAVWEGFLLSAAKTSKSSSENIRDDRKRGTVHGGPQGHPIHEYLSQGCESGSLYSSEYWEILPDEDNGYVLPPSLSFLSNLYIKLMLHSRVSNDF